MKFKKLNTIKDKIYKLCNEWWKNYVELNKRYPTYFVFPLFTHHHFMYYDFIMMFEEKRRRETYEKDKDLRNR